MQLKKALAALTVFTLAHTTPVLAQNSEVLITGQGIGITLNSQGAMVTETAQIETKDKEIASPAKSGGIKDGDVITELDGTRIKTVDDLQKVLSKTKGKPMIAKVIRQGAELTLKLRPVLSSDGQYRLGIWTKDAASGIGTLTYYDPETGRFGALGHGITDSSGCLIEIDGGDVLDATILTLKKGKKGEPGELQGIFGENDSPIGTIKENTSCGVFGEIKLSKEEIEKAQSIKVGTKKDVRLGKAYILANIEGDKTEKFEVEISNIPSFTGDVTKGMVITITDKKLLQKTGGIVRGMSGCPIVQSGRLVGAITHVFVNDPAKGYGIFIENMLENGK